jgi:Mrp family chromosome partitioning ATPase
MSAYFESLNRRRAAEAAAEAIAPLPAAQAPAQPAIAPVPAVATPAAVIAAPAPQPLSPAPPVARALKPAPAPRRRRERTVDLSVYASLRERLALAAGSGPAPSVVVFAGCEGGEGCTGIVQEFADHLATSGLGVLLVDVDMRTAPSPVEPAGADLWTLVQRDEPALAVPRGAGRLAVAHRPQLAHQGKESFLRSTELGRWLGRQRAAHDFILVDAPPVLRCADAVLASAHADGVVLIARTGTTARDALANAREQIERAHGTVLGAVLQDGRRPQSRRRPTSFTH